MVIGLTDWEESQIDSDPTNEHSDNDSLEDGMDAVPTDGEINWEKTAESGYIWWPQVETTGASAVSRHGHILFPGTRAEPPEILWDSKTSSYLNIVESSSWSGSGLLQETAHRLVDEDDNVNLWVTYEPLTFDDAYDEICDMNDEGSLVGFSSSSYRSEESVWIQDSPGSIMKWELSESTNQYESPVYFLASVQYNDYYDLSYDADRKSIDSIIAYSLIGESVRIADDGTVSGIADARPGILWVSAQSDVHCNEMSVWGTFDPHAVYPESPGAILDHQTGLFLDRFKGPSFDTALQYWDGQQLDDLENMLLMDDSLNSEIQTDISRTPVPVDATTGRVWFSVNYSGGSKAFIEKRSGGSGVNRWHNPPSMSEGAIRLNALGEAITETKIWRNGTYTPINDLVSKPESSDLEITKLIDLASNGIILAEATEGGVSKTGLLLKMDVENLREEIITDAFEVSNKVTDQNLDVQASPSIGDPRTYRVKLPVDLGASAKIRFDLYDEDGASVDRNETEEPENGELQISEKTENAVTFYATDNFRFVTWDTDDAHAGNQTIKVKLGDTVRMTLVIDNDDLAYIELPIGLPPSESSTKAIRTVDARFVKLDHGNGNAASSSTLIERMDKVFAQGAVRFNEIGDTTKGPVKNLISIKGSIGPNGVVLINLEPLPDGSPVSLQVNISPGDQMQVADQIASAINQHYGEIRAQSFSSYPMLIVDDGYENTAYQYAHVVLDVGDEVVYNLGVSKAGVGPGDIFVPTSDLSSGDVSNLHDVALLGLNYGDADPNTMDVFITDSLTAKGGPNNGYALTRSRVSSDSPLVNAYHIIVTASIDNGVRPFVAPHEAGHILLNAQHNLETTNLMYADEDNDHYTSDSDSIDATKRIYDNHLTTLRSASNNAAGMLQNK